MKGLFHIHLGLLLILFASCVKEEAEPQSGVAEKADRSRIKRNVFIDYNLLVIETSKYTTYFKSYAHELLWFKIIS